MLESQREAFELMLLRALELRVRTKDYLDVVGVPKAKM